MSSDKDYLQELENVICCFNSEDFSESIRLAKKILSKHPTYPILICNCSSILIDSGSALHDINSIKLGISVIEKTIPKIENNDFSLIANAEYNLANGYGSQADLVDRDKEQDLYHELINKQKRCLQNVLLKKDFLNLDLLSKVTANYGNLLFKLGRVVESVDYLYDCLELDKKHTVAMCNCSSALQKTINLSNKHNKRICHEFWRLMNNASQLREKTIELAGRNMHERCLHSLKAIEEYMMNISPLGLEGLKKEIEDFEAIHHWKPTHELSKIKRDRLFLTVNPSLANCVDHYKDDICFENMVTSLTEEGEAIFQKLVNTFNHIKEDFATARYLYYQSTSASKSLSQVSSITYYIESHNSLDFGLKTGLLKTSFRLAADLFDKSAGFINLYLKLNHPEDKVALNNFWYTKCEYKKGLHPIIQKLLGTNSFLGALRDLNRDLYLGNFPAPIRDLRNDATHKRLILSLYGSYQEYDKTIDIEKFEAITHLLLRMAKAAIIYLVGLIKVEEERRNIERRASNSEDKLSSGLSYQINYGLSDQFNLG